MHFKEVKNNLNIKISGPLIFSPKIFQDERGYFFESWKKHQMEKILKLEKDFVQENQSMSSIGVLRGLHYDNKTWKLISCPYGKIFFVVVNCNSKSKDYLKYKSWILDQKKNVQILVPPMFANGHLCLSDSCLFHYKLSYKGKYFDIDKQKVQKLLKKLGKNLILCELYAKTLENDDFCSLSDILFRHMCATLEQNANLACVYQFYDVFLKHKLPLTVRAQ